ncbi:hypothetical protein CL652_01315 [bacterium]|nr:hypothetical protein [bacterium]|tara:strand:+ start:655 stop:1533 length:879 start_codon:yes stop_codon:yes gene_type:complete
MKRVLILGASGMLGSAVYDVLKDKYELVLSMRDPKHAELLEKAYGGTDKHKVVAFDAKAVYENYLEKQGDPGEYLKKFVEEVGDVDYVINAVGVTIPFSMDDPILTFFTNGALPHVLAGVYGEKLIHVTTDCVYNGQEGFPYDEESPKTPVDIYGLSKSLGEPENCLTIRTSIIGRELKGFTSLLEWFLKQEGEDLTGFSDHHWNGITTKQFGVVCDKIMSEPEKYPTKGLYHVFSNSVTKYEMLLKFKEKFGVECNIASDDSKFLNRTMSTKKELNDLLDIPTFSEMVDDL